MLPKSELLKLTKCLGESISDNTLRNYIKANLVDGAIGSKTGISVRGKTTYYPISTAFHAVIAKAMMKRERRRLDQVEVVFARACAMKILKDANFYPDREQLSLLAKSFFGDAKYHDNGYGKGIVEIAEGKYQQLEQLEQYVFEWIYRFVTLMCTEINRLNVLSGVEIKVEPVVQPILIKASRPYIIFIDRRGFNLEDYFSGGYFDYYVIPEEGLIVHGTTQHFY